MNSRQQFLLLNIGVPLLFVGVAYFFIPIADAFQFSSDEGLELAKVDLYMRGFKLYDEIWNDQPPLPTVLWARWLSVFGHSILSARLLTLSFGTLLLWAFIQSIRLTNGFLPALLGGVGLIVSPHFVPMSTAVMMGVPSLSLAMLSSYCLLRFQIGSRWMWLISSGICFAISVELKAFSLFLIPVLLGYLGLKALHRPKSVPDLSHSPAASPDLRSTTTSDSQVRQIPQLQARMTDQRGRPRHLPDAKWLESHAATSLLTQLPWRAFSIWLGTFVFVSLLMMEVLPSENASQTIAAHFNGNLREAAGWDYGIGRLLEFLVKDPDYWLLSFFGLWSLRRRQTVEQAKTPNSLSFSLSFPILWSIAAFLVLLWHRPIHFHYYLLVSIPLTWLAAVGTSEAIKRWRSSSKERWLNLRWASVSGVALFCIWLAVIGLPIKSLVLLGEGRYATWKSTQYFEVLPQVMEYRAQTHWLFTDVLMYSFYAEIPVPPEIAVFSSKRLTSGNLTMDQLRTVLRRYRPEQLLLGRFDEVSEALKPEIESQYQRLGGNDVVQYYRLKASDQP